MTDPVPDCRKECGCELDDTRKTEPLNLRALAFGLAAEVADAPEEVAERFLQVLARAQARMPRSSAEVLRLCPELLKLEDGKPGAWLKVGIPSEWTTKRGEVVPIAEMSDQHLFHTVRFLVRVAARRRALEVGRSIGFMDTEFGRPRGDGAQMACGDTARGLAELIWADRACGYLWATLAEARARGLPGVDVETIAAYGAEADSMTLGLELKAMKRITDADRLARVRAAVR